MLKNQTWKKTEYSRRQINDAGNIMRKETLTPDEENAALAVIDNWRASHAYPLHVMYIHLRRLAKSSGALVVERLKRLDSIVGKLKRTPKMELWRMQDLGGCRCVLNSVDEVYAFAEKYKSSRIRHEFVRDYDYIKEPKLSGYRSIHLVYKFHSDKKETYNRNMLVELQFRTHLQHIWSTALETMGIFTKQNLKASQGDEHIKRFFVLVSSLFAMEEGCPIVPGTIADKDELISELESINAQYNTLDTLKAIHVFANVTRDTQMKKSGYYMLLLDFKENNLFVRYFLPSQIEEANMIYARIEKNRVESKLDAVLVRAESFKELKRAYPNYFADITEFVGKVTAYLN